MRGSAKNASVGSPEKRPEYVLHQRRGWFFAGLAVVATLLVVNVTLVVGKHSPIWDAADLGCPNQILLADYARHGHARCGRRL